MFRVIIACKALLFCACAQKTEAPTITTALNKEPAKISNRDTLLNYVDSLFLPKKNFTLKNTDTDTLMRFVQEKIRHDTSRLLSPNFVSSIICDVKNDCLDNNNNIYYYSLGRIKVNDSLVLLIYEKYEKKFPVLFTNAYSVVFNNKKRRIVDKLIIYKDNNIGILNCDEIGCESITNNEIRLKYKYCKDFFPKNEEERNYLSFEIVDEYFVINIKTGKFESVKKNKHSALYDQVKQNFLFD